MERPETKYARSGDVSIAYQSIGDGERTILVVPGFVSNVELCWAEPVFHHLITRLASYARVLLFDKRGTGLSDPVAAPPTFEERTDDIRAVLDAAGVERAVVNGLSEGGPMAMLFAATHPDRVSHLVLYGTFAAGPEAYGVEEPRAEDWRRSILPVMRDAIEHWGEGRSLELFGQKVAHRPLERRLWATWERSGSSPGVVGHLFESMLHIDVRDILPVISVPTLVMRYEGDIAVPHWATAEVASNIPGAELAVIPGGDHVVFELPAIDAASDEIEAFVTGVRPAARAERRLLTVVFTDIVASTELAAELGDAAWGEKVGAHDRVVRSVLAEHHGREVKTLGDGFLATFDGPGRSLAFARAAREQVRAMGLELRVGIHTGECDVTDDDVRGLAVNIASRVCTLAGPGEILLTSTVRELTAGSGAVVAGRGRHVLKGVPGDWELGALDGLASSAAATDPRQPTSTPARRRSDRVLDRLAARYPSLARTGVRTARRLATR